MSSMQYLRWAGLGWVVVWMSACQSAPARAPYDTGYMSESLAASVRQAQAARAVPAGQPEPEITTALLPPLTLELRESDLSPAEPRFDLTVKEAPAAVFFMSLVRDTSYNMVVHPGVSGTVSLALKQVTVPEVMEAVRSVYGYEYRRSGHGFEVLESNMRARIFKIDYLNLSRRGESQIRVSSGQISETTSSTGNDGGGKSSASKSILSGSRVDTSSDVNFWAELKDALRTLIGDADGRKVVVNPQSGIIIVRAMPAELRVVEDYLMSTQKIIRRQVILEAKILEVRLSDGFQAGINWAALGHQGDNSAVFGQTGGGTVFDGAGYSETRGASGNLNPGALDMVSGTATSAFGGMFSMAVNAGDFTAFIEMLSGQGEVHVLSSPRIATVNNQKAVIKVGQDEFFVTDVSSESNTAATGVATSQSVNVELTPFFSGVALDVIPQIDEQNGITLHIHPSVSEVREKIKQINVTSTDQLTVPLALSTIRESDSIVRAQSGQVVVVGGLMQDTVQDTVVSVPFFGSLPVVGALFRHTKQVSVKSELVLLLRPVVVQDGADWANLVQESSNLMRNHLADQEK